MFTKVMFGIGESVQGILIMISGYYLNSFYLETACIDPVLVSLMQGLTGVWDSVNDPIIGALSDRTRTRWGRRRPWLLFGAPVVALFYFGLWNALPHYVPQFWKFVYACVMYMGVSCGITAIQVQVGALVPELTDDYDERTSLAGWRIGIMSVAGLIAAVCHNMFVNIRTVSHNASGFRISGGVFGVVMWAAAWTFFAGIREKWQSNQESRKQMGFAKSIKLLLRNRPFICVAGAYLCGPTAVCLIQSNILMLCKYNLGDADIVKKIIPMVQGSGLLCLPLWVAISRRFDKRKIYLMGGSCLVMAMCAIYFIRTEVPALICSGVIGVNVSVVYLVPYSMLPDVIEEDELRTGKRREGMFVGFFTIMLKLSVTMTLTITNLLLKILGYSAPSSSCQASITDDSLGVLASELAQSSTGRVNIEGEGLPDQPGGVLVAIQMMCSFIPAMFMLTAMALVWKFPITRAKQAAMAKLAAQARLERSTQQSETSSVTSTHSPRDLQALSDFLDEVNDVRESAVLDEMQKTYAEFRCQEHQEYQEQAFSPARRPGASGDKQRSASAPAPRKIGAAMSESSHATTAGTIRASDCTTSIAETPTRVLEEDGGDVVYSL